MVEVRLVSICTPFEAWRQTGQAKDIDKVALFPYYCNPAAMEIGQESAQGMEPPTHGFRILEFQGNHHGFRRF